MPGWPWPRARRVLPLSARAPCSLSRERDPQGGWRLVTPGLEQAFRAAPEWPLARYPWVGMPREPKLFLEPPGCCLRSRLVSSVLEPAPRARGYFPMLRCPRWRESHEPVLPSPLPRLAWNGCLGSPRVMRAHGVRCARPSDPASHGVACRRRGPLRSGLGWRRQWRGWRACCHSPGPDRDGWVRSRRVHLLVGSGSSAPVTGRAASDIGCPSRGRASARPVMGVPSTAA